MPLISYGYGMELEHNVKQSNMYLHLKGIDLWF